MWLPERITPAGANSLTKPSETSQGWLSQYTCASRTRRAMSWVYWAPKSRIRILWCLLDAVIRRLLDDLDVVHMRLAHAGGRDLDELRLGAHLVYGRGAGVAHAGAQAPHELVDHPDRAALVRHAT